MGKNNFSPDTARIYDAIHLQLPQKGHKKQASFMKRRTVFCALFLMFIYIFLF